MPSGSLLSPTSGFDERPLPGIAGGLSYPVVAPEMSSPFLSPVKGQTGEAMTPRLANRTPFRPIRRPKDRSVSDEVSAKSRSSDSSLSSDSLPGRGPITSSHQPQASSSRLPAREPSPRKASLPTPSIASGSNMISEPIARPRLPMAPSHAMPTRCPSPTKPSEAPRLRNAISQVFSSTAEPRGPRVLKTSHPPPSRPASPVKVKAKVTEGVSPRRKANKNVSPQKPNIVRRGVPQTALSPASWDHFQGMDIGEEQGGTDSSFVYHASDDSMDQSSRRESNDTVKVHLRLRPLPETEPSAWLASTSSSSITLQPSLAAGRSSGTGDHYFDALHTGSSNDGVYRTLARPLVHSVLSGFNALIFAYGQTASGKTWTLSGDDKTGTEGITQMAVRDLFKGIRNSNKEREWLVRCSWCEVYNEAVADLLEPSNVPQIRSSVARGTFVAPLAEVIVTSPTSIFELMENGQKNRHVNATDWNERSSRSHTAFKIIVESWAREEGQTLDPDGRPMSPEKGRNKKVRVSELVLVDLAGSEKYVTQGGKERRAEGANINKSLLTLGKVIFALSEKGSSSAASQPHIPYRDSKLTRILQNSLSGNSKIAVVATLNQTVSALDESLSTIQFAKRIKKVQLSARLNEVDAPDSSDEAQALLVKYRNEADSLRRLVKELQSREMQRSSSVNESSSAVGASAMEERIEELEGRLLEIGDLFVRGEGLASGDETSESEEDYGTATSLLVAGDATYGDRSASVNGAAGTPQPRMPSHLDFKVPSSTLRQDLHSARLRIASLQTKLHDPTASRQATLSLPSSEKDELIAQLQQQLSEAEIALEASSLQPLPKVREEVEAEYLPRIAALEKEREQYKALNEQLIKECERLEKVNRRLIMLAHRETSELVGRLREENGTPTKKDRPQTPLSSTRGLRPQTPVTTGRGGDRRTPGSVTCTPTMRRLRGDDPTSRERPKSVLGDLGMRSHNLLVGGGRPGSPTPLSRKDRLDVTASAGTGRLGGTLTPGRNMVALGGGATPSPLRKRRSRSSSVSRDRVSSAAKLQRKSRPLLDQSFTLAGEGGNSDGENADESVLMDLKL